MSIDSSNRAELYRVLFEEAADGIFITDSGLRLIAVNPRAAELSGYSVEELLGMDILEFIPPDERSKSLDRIEDLRRGKRLTLERRMTRHDGSVLPVEFSARILPAGNVIGIVRDISERKRAEEELIAGKNIMSRAEIISSYGSWEINLNTRKIKGSEGALKIYGLKSGELQLSEVQKIPLPEYRDMLDRALNDLISKNIPYNVEFKILNQETKKVIDIYSVAEYDRRRNVVLGIVQDITGRKTAEELLRKSENRMRSLIDSAPFGAHIYELDGHNGLVFRGYNKSADRILVIDHSQFLGKTIEEAFPPLIETEIPAMYKRAAATGEGYNTNQVDYENGEIRGAFEVHAFQISPRWMTAFFMDITERKKAELEKERLQEQLLQAQKMESVGRLAGGIAHDFNNLLNVILGHAELSLMNIKADHPFFESFRQIQSAAQHSAELTRQLLTFARRQTIAPRILDLNVAVGSMLKMLRRMIGEDIDLAWIPDKELRMIRIDPSQVTQVLANLCVNARDAIEDVGKITIETKNISIDNTYCDTHPGFVPGEFVMLAVSDNGCGMDKDTLNKIFEPFFTTKELGKGTGLGLATIYGIVRQNSGFINVYSEPGKGTMFRIYFPMHTGKGTAQEKESEAEGILRGNETILLVEDESSILGIVKVMLESLGYSVLAASAPAEALRVAGKNSDKIKLLLTDVIMPEMNGRELSEKLTSLYPHFKCLYMSGYSANVIAHHGVLEEGIHFIQKPFSIQSLSIKVREVLDSK